MSRQRDDYLVDEVRGKWNGGKGESQESLAREYEVSVRTIQRWCSGQNAPRVKRVSGQKAPPDWPAERLWPATWTLDALVPKADTAEEIAIHDAWERALAVVASAEAQGALFVPWFYRNCYAVVSEELPDITTDWQAALAALPVLGEWLQVNESTEAIAKAIREHRPWQGRKGRAAYQRVTAESARILSRALSVRQAVAQGEGLRSGRLSFVLLLGELLRRIPQFDQKPRRWTFSRRFSPELTGLLGGIFMAIPNEEI